MYSIHKTLIVVLAYSISMAMLEAAVVIYMREIYYSGGFSFPMPPIKLHLIYTELAREAATIIMLISVGWLAGKCWHTRFAWFIISFAVWDIFYYVFLKVFLNWPDHITDWDILFLLPVPWVGPVLSPVLVSLCMILFGLSILYFSRKSDVIAPLKKEWLTLFLGCSIVLFTYTADYFHRVIYFSLHEADISKAILTRAFLYVPKYYNWPLCWLGLGVILAAIALYCKRLWVRVKSLNFAS